MTTITTAIEAGMRHGDEVEIIGCGTDGVLRVLRVVRVEVYRVTGVTSSTSVEIETERRARWPRFRAAWQRFIVVVGRPVRF